MKIGTRVELLPHLDRWMQGNRYGEVVKIGSRFIDVKMDRTGKTVRYLLGDVKEV